MVYTAHVIFQEPICTCIAYVYVCMHKAVQMYVCLLCCLSTLVRRGGFHVLLLHVEGCRWSLYCSRLQDIGVAHTHTCTQKRYGGDFTHYHLYTSIHIFLHATYTTHTHTHTHTYTHTHTHTHNVQKMYTGT